MTVNPYKPGAGHPPPFLAGRDREIAEFGGHLQQEPILKNLILTGLRGTGKTVLMDSKYKPLAQKEDWVWVGSDFSESSFLSENHLCTRLITDLSVFTSTLPVPSDRGSFGFSPRRPIPATLDYETLMGLFARQPGLAADKLKACLWVSWIAARSNGAKGIVFAYDEAQLVRDNRDKEEYPLAVMLETFQSLQKAGARLMLMLTGLPTLFARLVESRTYAERMFTVQEIGRLDERDARSAIMKPVANSRWKFTQAGVAQLIEVTAGYPYFIQFFCRETFDHRKKAGSGAAIPVDAIVRKLDSDFFAGRWEQLSDRMRELLFCVAALDTCGQEFTIPEIVAASKRLPGIKSFTRGDISQLLPRLMERGLIYKNRHGKYSFAVPLFDRFIRRKWETKPE